MLQGTTQFLHGKEDILDLIHASGISSRFHAAALVGVGGNHSNRVFELVDRLSQRLVLRKKPCEVWQPQMRTFQVRLGQCPTALGSKDAKKPQKSLLSR